MDSKKVLILGIDGLDPRLTKRYLDEGKMPNTAKFLARGAAQRELEMIAASPPSRAHVDDAGDRASPRVHGITAYYRHNIERDIAEYNFDSTNCRAEQLWNVTAEAGLKTLVCIGRVPLGRQAQITPTCTSSTGLSRAASMSAPLK